MDLGLVPDSSSFSVFPGDQSLSTFPECILLGGSDPGVHGPPARWTRLPTSPSAGVTLHSASHSTRGLTSWEEWLLSFGAPVFLDVSKTALVSDSSASQTAPLGNPANKTAPHLSCRVDPPSTHTRCIYTTPWTVPQVNLIPPLAG